MTTQSKLPAPPYVSFRTFINFLDWLGQVGVPSRIDRSFWSQKLGGATGGQLITALKFFGLVSEKRTPDPMLEQLARGRPDERKPLLRSLMARYDAALEGLDLERATAGELDERFRRYDVSGETFRRAITFFVQAAKYCAIPLSPYITERKRVARPNGGGAQLRRGRPPKVKAEGEKPEAVVVTPTTVVDSLGLHPSVTAMLSDLNRISAGWDETEQTRWIETFLAVLKYAYPAASTKGKEMSS